MVALFKRERLFDKKIEKRVHKISSADLTNYIEESGYAVQRCLSEYSRNNIPAQLDQALQAAEAIHCLVYEIKRRNISP